MAADAVVHHAVELRVGHLADAGLFVGRDVGRVDLAEGRIHRQAAGHRLAARRGVTGYAVPGGGEVFALGDQRRLILGRRRRCCGHRGHRNGRGQAARQDGLRA
jgi:hypothetical protein